MWAAFKALSWGTKIGIAIGILIALAGIVGGAYYGGYTKGSARADTEILGYKNKVSDLSGQLKTAQGKVSVQVVTKYLDRVQTVTKTVVQNHDVIKTQVVPTFTLTRGWVYSYNQSALGLPIDPKQAADTTASGVSDAQGLLTLNDNNGKYTVVAARLTALQEWAREQQNVNKTVGHASEENTQPVSTGSEK